MYIGHGKYGCTVRVCVLCVQYINRSGMKMILLRVFTLLIYKEMNTVTNRVDGNCVRVDFMAGKD
jgi:hypothetical protein